MKTLVIFVLSALSVLSVLSVKDVQTPATIATPEAEWEMGSEWKMGSIYQISILDGCPRLKGKEVLLSVPLFDAVQTIRMDDNTAYSDYNIEFKYIEEEDLYIANLLDEFVEL